MAGAGGHSHPRAFVPGAPVIQQTQRFPLDRVKNFSDLQGAPMHCIDALDGRVIHSNADRRGRSGEMDGHFEAAPTCAPHT